MHSGKLHSMGNFRNVASVKKLLLIIAMLFFSYQNIYANSFNADSLENVLNNLSGKEKVETLNSLADTFLKISPDKSIVYANRAVVIAKKYSLNNHKSFAYTLLGDAYYYIGDFDSAIVNYRKSLKILNEFADSTKIADMLNNIGLARFNLSELDTALHYYYKALRIYRNNNDKNREAVMLMNLGNLFLTKMNYINAVEFYQSSLSIHESQGNNDFTSHLLHNIGLVYMDWGYYDKALQYMEKSLRLCREKGNKINEATAASNIALINISQGNFDMAIKNLELAHGIYSKFGNKVRLSTIYNSLGIAYLKKKEYEKAKKYFLSSLQLAKTLDWKEGFVINDLGLGELFFETNDLVRSLQYYKKGLALANQLKMQEYIIKGNLGISDVYLALNNTSMAYLHFKKYSLLKDSVFTMKTHGQITEIQTKYETAKKEKENELLIYEKSLKEVELNKEKTFVRVGILFIILLFVIGFLALRSIKLKQKSETNELKSKNLEMQKRLLRSQMNPHFIFNSLNSIQSLISGNKPDMADIYLVKFARLMRSILMNTQKTFIVLEEEINFIKLYVEIEQLRFDNSFKYEIIIDDNILTDVTYIPPMLVQPFVENALMHGLINKVNNGKLTVGFKPKGNIIQCTITDNGIGRQKAGEIKRKSRYENKPMGIRLTKDRLKLLNIQSNSEIVFEIVDLKDSLDNALGTKVILNLPKKTDANKNQYNNFL